MRPPGARDKGAALAHAGRGGSQRATRGLAAAVGEGGALTELYLVRHGEAESNALAYVTSTVPGPGLTERGQRQALAVADTLAARLAVLPVLVSSPLRRALETALPTAARLGLPVAPEEGLREIGLGAWEGRLARDLMAEDPEFPAWRADPETHSPPGGERGSAVGGRVRRALTAIAGAAGERPVVAFSHQDALAGMLTAITGRDWRRMHDWRPDLPNAVLVHLRFDAALARFDLVAIDKSASQVPELSPVERPASTSS